MPPTISTSTLWQELRSIDVGLLDELAFLSALRGRSGRSSARYATPSRTYLARKLAISVGTISRHTTRLVALGVLSKRQRRPVDGKWQTNIYVLTGRAAWAVVRVLQSMRRRPHRVPSGAHKPPSEGGDGERGHGRSALRAIIRTLEAKLRPP